MSIITGVILYDIVGALVATFTILYFYCKWAFTFWRDKGVPYLEPTLFWGDFRPPHRKIVNIGDELMQLYKKAKEKGLKHVGLYNMTSPLYVPLELELVKCILTKDFNNFYERGFYYNEEKEPIGAHLFAIGGKKWRNLRTKFTPTFTSGKMRMMFQTIADCGTQLETYLLEYLDHHEPFDIKFILGNFSTDIIGSCAFGIECNSFKEPNNLFRKMGNRFFNTTPFENLKLMFALNFVKLARFLGITIIGKEISDFFSKVVKDTVNYREKNNVQRKDFMQLLIEIKNTPVEQDHIGDGTSLTLDEMTAQSFVFFLAGFETSSTTMTFALYELSKNQDIQQRVRDEINTVLKKHDGKVTYDALNEMHYLSQVIDETLRMYPPVPLITRVCVEDYVVPGMNVELKKGQRVFIPIRAIHYDEEYYPSPEVFDPERFSDENKHDRNPYAHIPFGEGPRICIGMRFGIMQSKVGLISILKNFNVTLNKKTKQPLKLDVYSFVPQADGGIWLNLEKIV